MSDTPTETLRRASALMRGRANDAAAQPQTGARVEGVWLNSRFHLAWHPAVALAVADLINNIIGAQEQDVAAIERDALAVARTYLKESA